MFDIHYILSQSHFFENKAKWGMSPVIDLCHGMRTPFIYFSFLSTLRCYYIAYFRVGEVSVHHRTYTSSQLGGAREDILKTLKKRRFLEADIQYYRQAVKQAGERVAETSSLR